jgi:PAS domain S-box-containing protein
VTPPVTPAASAASRARDSAHRRVRVFAAAGAVAVATLPLAGHVEAPEAAVAFALYGALAALIVLAPAFAEERHPDVAALLGLVVVAVLRDAAGGAQGGYGILALLPVLWVALYGRRGDLVRTLIGVALVFALPLVAVGGTHYPAATWRGAVLVVGVFALVGAIVQEGLGRERRMIAGRARLLGAIADGVIVTDVRGRVLEVNPALCAMTGYSAEEILGSAPPLPSWPADDHRALLHAHAAAIAAGGGEFEARLVRRDGTEFHAIVRLAVDGDPGGERTVIATVKDVTERVALRGQLLAERDRSRAVIDSMIEGFGITRDGKLVDVNPALCRITGFSRDELVGAEAPFPFWPPEFVASLDRVRHRVRDDEGGTFEATFMRADGTRFFAEVATTQLYEDGRATGFLNSVRDITERKQEERAVLDRAKQMAALARVTRAVAQAGPDEARRVVCDMARRSVDADVATLWEPDGDGNLHNTAMLGAPQVDVTLSRDFSASGARIAYRTGEPVFIRDAAGSPALDPRLREHVGCASVHFQPIASEFGVRGVLALCWNEPLAEVGSARAHLIEVLAHEASIAISRTALPPARIAR